MADNLGSPSPATFDPFAGPQLELTAPSTEPQREIWTAAQLGPEASLAFNESISLELRGPLDLEALRHSLSELVSRHESLRATFTADGLVFCVLEGAAVPFELVDLSERPAAARQAEHDAVLARAVESPFDLERGPLARVVVLRLEPELHVVVFTAHHIVVDGWSWSVLVSDWARLYSARKRSTPAALAPASRFSAYATQQAARRGGPEWQATQAYWVKQFSGELPVLDLPADRPRPKLRGFASRRIDFLVPAELVGRVKRVGAASGASLFATLLAAYQAWLHRLSGQQDVVVGVPAAGQSQEGFAELVGHCVQTLPLRSRIDPSQPFRELLKQVRSTVLDGFEHQQLTFGELLRELPISRDPSRPPLVTTLFNLDRPVPEAALAFEGLAARLGSNPRHFEAFDLFVNGVETAAGLLLECQYNSGLFDAATVERLLRHFQQLLASIAADPSVAVGRLGLLDKDDLAQLGAWNDTRRPVADASVHELVEQRARRSPDAVAVVQGERSVSYRELLEEADRLAARLRAAGVRRGTLVGLLLERTPTLVAGVLGVLKAGGAYVPLDPAYPDQRLDFMIRDCETPVLLTQSSLSHRVSPATQRVLLVDQPDPDAAPGRADQEAARGDDTAYVIYTSGSTGKPKGVLVSHANVVNLLESVRERPGMTQSDVVLAITTLSFDIAVSEILLPLVAGARIVLASREEAADGPRLIELIRRHGVSFVDATPATWRLLIESGWAGSERVKAICTGEAMPAELPALLLPRVASLWNAYGPTETTVWATLHQVTSPLGRVVIGRPIANTQVHVLDGLGQQLPVGVAGELHIGGRNVAAGYWRRPELTAERFIPDPFGAEPAARLYRTGDLGRWLADGTLECLGRIDFQVKLRGYRIELGEIEAALAGHAAVARAVAITREDRPGDVRLVAYCVPRPGTTWDEAGLRAHLARFLPEYMVPQHFVSLDALPLTPSGKVDRKALPAPADRASTAAESLGPRTGTERAVAATFQEVLGIPRLDVRDSFFQLGGHSLLAAQLVARLARDHGIAVSMRTVFEAPTVERLARVVDQAEAPSGQATRPIPRRPNQSEAPATPMQQRLWFLQQTDPGLTALNVPSPFYLRGRLDVAALERALNEIRRRHASMRSVFEWRDGALVQIVHDRPAPLSLADPLDLRALPADAREPALFELLQQRMVLPFDLTRDPLVRFELILLDAELHALSFVAHHIIWDGWSFDVFRKELDVLYGAFCEGRPSPLPEPAVSYGDFAEWQRAWLAGPELERHLAYWKGQLAGELPPLDLPGDRPRPAVRSDAGDGCWLQLTRAETDQLAAVAGRYECTPFMLLLSAFQVLLHRYTGQSDVRIGNAARGRSHPDLQDLIGLFVNTLVLRARVEPRMPFSELMRHAREVTLGAFSHEEMPFELLVRELGVARDASRTPLVQHLFSYQDARGRSNAIADVGLSLVPVQVPSAQTDLTLWLMETSAGLTGALNYSTELFDAGTIERMLGHYRRLLDAVLADPELPVGELPLMTDAERHELLVAWNDTGSTDRPGASVHELFAEVAAARPEAIAVVDPERSLSYAELDRRSNQLARHLRDAGVGRDVVVGLCVPRSAQTLVALLGILKAGGAYLALEAGYPRQRLAFMLEDASVPVLLATDATADAFPDFRGRLVRLDLDADRIAAQSADPLASAASGADLAYVTYTSGSTGKPKGVEIPQRAVNRLVRGAAWAELGPEAVLLHAAPLAFDASTFEIWGALLNGGCCVLHPEEIPTARGLSTTIARHRVTTAWLTAALFNAIVDEDPAALSGLRQLLIGGEALSVPHVRRAYQALPSTRILNGYGPTECTTFTTIHPIPRELDAAARSVPIGRPIRDTRVYVLDGERKPVPTGVVGELHVGGAGLARGYLGRPELTAAQFVFAAAAAPGERLYRTGDLVRWLSDGTLDFVGRRDTQVKLRGFRIELGEIEARLAEHPGLRQAAVVCREDRPGDVRLVAYFVGEADADFTSTELRDFLRESLPDYMLPSHFVELDAFPLSASGKLDRRALPAPGHRHDEDADFVAPRDSSERLVASTWSELLGVERVGVHDNFFELGGHSLLCLEAIARLERSSGARLNPREMLFGTLEAVAGRLRELAAAR